MSEKQYQQWLDGRRQVDVPDLSDAIMAKVSAEGPVVPSQDEASFRSRVPWAIQGLAVILAAALGMVQLAQVFAVSTAF